MSSPQSKSRSASCLRRTGAFAAGFAFLEMENRYLRVLLLEDGKTVHNAFFDRGYQP